LSIRASGSAIEACEAAWRFYGGVFRVVIPDNTAALITTADPLQPRVVVAFLEYAQARGFVIDPARVRRPTDKARVERSVPYVRDDCFAGERLATLDQARGRAVVWRHEEAGTRRHARTQRRPASAAHRPPSRPRCRSPATSAPPPSTRSAGLDTLPERLVRARQQHMAPQDFLLLLLHDEVARRDSAAVTLRATLAPLDPGMALEQWDATAKVTYDRALWNELVALRFLQAHAHVAIVGPVGMGKTFFADAFGWLACRHGYTVLALTADRLLKQQSRPDSITPTRPRSANSSPSISSSSTTSVSTPSTPWRAATPTKS